MENFFRHSNVSSFFERNEGNLTDDFIIDYDSRSYVRVMKLFHQSPETRIDFKDYLFEEEKPMFGVNLNDKFNEDFYLRFYLPKYNIGIAGKKNLKVIIMFNGLNELQQFDLYDMLGEYFANNNIAVVLLPTPLNLNRRIAEDFSQEEKIYPSTRALNGNPGIFYLSYIKSYKELSFLAKKLKGTVDNLDSTDDFSFYQNYFDGKNIEINLLGYSLGGVKALAYFMKDFDSIDEDKLHDFDFISQSRAEQKFQSCITFNSGANLQEAKVESLKLDQTQWDLLLSAVRIWLNEREEEITKKFLDHHELNMAFKALYFRKNAYDKELKKFRIKKVNNILMNFFAISGGSDLIVNINQMQTLSPKTRINQLIVAKGDHHPGMHKSEWHDVLLRVEKSMLDFINSCGERSFKQNMVLTRIKKLIEQAKAVNFVKENCREKFNQLHLTFILDNLSEEQKIEFKTWLYRSKAHYPHFSEIILKLFPK